MTAQSISPRLPTQLLLTVVVGCSPIYIRREDVIIWHNNVVFKKVLVDSGMIEQYLKGTEDGSIFWTVIQPLNLKYEQRYNSSKHVTYSRSITISKEWFDIYWFYFKLY